MVKRAFMSVFDKTGILEFAQALQALGVEIISTGGTAAALEAGGVKVTSVSDVTGYPECLDGRVKTLHPNIHAGLLAMRSNPEHMRQIGDLNIEPIDLVVVNLYPFKQTVEKPGVTLAEAIENIDIGGPTALRAAAKNYQDVVVLVNPADYAPVLAALRADGEVSREEKLRLCYKVVGDTAAYDALIADYLCKHNGIEYPDKLTLTFDKVQDMRYGENPHQSASFYREPFKCPGTLVDAVQLQGKELSYNNINDANGALDLLREFDSTAAVAVKHANPCGVGLADTVSQAYKRAYEGDPMSVFGGIVALNGTVDAETAGQMIEIFLEIVIAPDYTDEALKLFKKKKNLRVLKLEGCGKPLARGQRDMRRVAGGLLVQQLDQELFMPSDWKVVTKRAPSEKEIEDMMLAWRIVKHVKSNGIAIAKDGQSLGIGPGQVNRFWPTESAIERSGDKVRGAALGSDAYFPFNDCAAAAAKAGITAIIQPGGSKNDQDSIDVCDANGIAMVFTNMRHFKH